MSNIIYENDGPNQCPQPNRDSDSYFDPISSIISPAAYHHHFKDYKLNKYPFLDYKNNFVSSDRVQHSGKGVQFESSVCNDRFAPHTLNSCNYIKTEKNNYSFKNRKINNGLIRAQLAGGSVKCNSSMIKNCQNFNLKYNYTSMSQSANLEIDIDSRYNKTAKLSTNSYICDRDGQNLHAKLNTESLSMNELKRLMKNTYI
ncbi:hypothetical protein A3Q56_00964 [Intoshia linei]|uniref:Uncharacterized protein n=1 Tax=Intoshia linei TaxID=1819745 RepID=A0A177BCN6_9BILA|nr:hypothetical protein A3Q56_00964 [Intoshia linei]